MKNSLESRIVESLRPSFQEFISNEADYWAAYDKQLDIFLDVYTRFGYNDLIRDIQYVLNAGYNGNPKYDCAVDVASTLEEADSKYQNVFKY